MPRASLLIGTLRGPFLPRLRRVTHACHVHPRRSIRTSSTLSSRVGASSFGWKPVANPTSSPVTKAFGVKSLSAVKPEAGTDAKQVVSCQVGPAGLAVQFNGDKVSTFHYIWLRDNCRCEACFHPITKQRLVDTFSINLDTAPTTASVSLSGGLSLTWPDGHQTDIPASFLIRHSYDPPLATPKTKRRKHMWGADIANNPPKVGYEAVMQGDEGVLEWLRRIDKFGFCLVDGVPSTPKATDALVRRIAFIRETHYGSFWDFTANLEYGDTAYTRLPLRAHTDTTYFSDPAGLQLFHLLSNTTSHTGGTSLLVDGLHCASRLSPSSFQILSTHPIGAHASGGPSTLVRPVIPKPVLELDPGSKQLAVVRWNGDDRKVVNGTKEEVMAWYKAAREWESLVRSEKMEFWMQMKVGQALIFDNHRVLHGRSSYTGKRRLCGAYVNGDDWRSRLRILERRISLGAGEWTESVWDEVD